MESLGIDLDRAAMDAWLEAAREFATPRLFQSLLLLLGAALLFLLARWLLGRVEERLAARTETKIDDLAARLGRRLVTLSVAFWAVWRLAYVWELPTTARTIGAVWIAALSIPIGAFVADVLAVYEERIAPTTTTTLDDTALPLLNKAARFVVIALGILVALEYQGIDISPILAGAGVIGLAVSLAAKDTLSNLIAGILLILDRPFQVGDRIELWEAPDETGGWGDVVEIGLRATKIRNPDNLIVVIPNNEIMKRDIVNYTASGPHIRLRIPIGIAYDADVEEARSALVEIARTVDGVKERPDPVVIVRRFGASSIDLELRVWIDDARARRAVADQIAERAKRALDERGVEIPYPKRDLYLRSGLPPESTAAPGSTPSESSSPGSTPPGS
ncbi:MAG: mechanosensitive ion channel family protein [Gemmatimonadota bacterium]|nr:mechanosensitive ion channel family protein [Gemmatimonadota bacterium]